MNNPVRNAGVQKMEIVLELRSSSTTPQLSSAYLPLSTDEIGDYSNSNPSDLRRNISWLDKFEIS